MPKRKSKWWADHEVKKPKAVTTVQIIESERGWGQKVDATHYFDDREAAEAFCKDYNKDNKPGPAPDWYMIARIV
jgi:hypothetical protein